ncbi:MAG: hypothetical protein LBS08_01055 [Candidatus Symbiothrix sp.]|nr:hypothetical protein [Candidatus Symbiothrix sp.]
MATGLAKSAWQYSPKAEAPESSFTKCASKVDGDIVVLVDTTNPKGIQ